MSYAFTLLMFYVQVSICDMCGMLSVLCAVPSVRSVQSLVCVMCRLVEQDTARLGDRLSSDRLSDRPTVRPIYVYIDRRYIYA